MTSYESNTNSSSPPPPPSSPLTSSKLQNTIDENNLTKHNDKNYTDATNSRLSGLKLNNHISIDLSTNLENLQNINKPVVNDNFNVDDDSNLIDLTQLHDDINCITSKLRNLNDSLVNKINTELVLNNIEKSLVIGNENTQNELSNSQASSLHDVSSYNQDANISNSSSKKNNNKNNNSNVNKTNEMSNDVGKVAKWAICFEKLLDDPTGLHVFTDFLKKEFSEENIDFWVICENFKKITDPAEMKKEADRIWHSYLDTSSSHQINVDNKARSRCKEHLSNPTSTMFEMAQTQIFTLMRYDSYSRFLKSQTYKDCMVNEMEGKPIYTSISNVVNSCNNSSFKSQSSSTNVLNSAKNDLILNRKPSSSNLNTVNSNNNINSTNNNLSASSSNDNSSNFISNIPNGAANVGDQSNIAIAGASSSSNSESNKKDKKKGTIIPWTKALIKWKRLSGTKEKKAGFNEDGVSIKSPTITSGVAVTLGKGINHKAPILLSTISPLDCNEEQQLADSVLQMDKLCKIYYNDGSSSMIMIKPGETCFEILNKILIKKNIPWFKCDIYFLGDYQPIDPSADSQVLGSKEICIAERCLFILSLTPIAINLCIKTNKKKNINSVLQPIFDQFQLKSNNCIIYLNSANCQLNLNDLCSVIDNQHILMVHKHQSNMLSLMEIDKYVNMSIRDFVPSNCLETEIHFDELGIMKQFTHTRSIRGKTSQLKNNNDTNLDVGLTQNNKSNEQLKSLSSKLDEDHQVNSLMESSNNQSKLSF